MGTEKKNRTQRDEKESIGSVDNGSGNNAPDPSSSLAARRAKLRGALGGRSTHTSDPFSAPPPAGYSDYQADPSSYQNEPSAFQSDPSGFAYQDPTGGSAGYQTQAPNKQGDEGSQEDGDAEVDPQVFYAQDAHNQAIDPSTQTFAANQANQTNSGQSPHGIFPPEPDSSANDVNVYGVPTGLQPSQQPEPIVSEEPVAELPPAARAPRTRRATASHSTAGLVEPAPVEPAASVATEAIETAITTAETIEPLQSPRNLPLNAVSLPPLAPIPEATTELINSIDQSLNVCATNLAALQNLAGEQNDVLKGLTQTLQNQTLLEIGLNLNSLTESLTAALEPMKAIGELVPALDALVSALETKDQEQTEKLSPDTLVTSLADQLSAGVIDPWTFKCAYMAVYPTDHPADLLHRLVELLGSQRLSGDLFRAAYEAIQAAEAPPRATYANTGGGGEANYTRSISDDAIKSQLEALERANRELQARQEERERELTAILAQKESELDAAQSQLNERFEEINNRYADAAEMIANREDEFRAALESKDMDLIEKDAELNMLRAQMEELRSQTEDMVKDLQKEMQRLKVETTQLQQQQQQAGADPAKAGSPNSQGFFDPSAGQTRAEPSFEVAPNPKPMFAPANQSDSGSGFSAANPQLQQSAPQFAQAQTGAFQGPPQPAFQPPNQTFTAPQNQTQQLPAQQPAPAGPQQVTPPRPPAPNNQGAATTPFGGQSGSYGMGVRQQVFEVIVRQALAGAPWREICAGPMQVNNISPDEVESEVKRRQSMLNK